MNNTSNELIKNITNKYNKLYLQNLRFSLNKQINKKYLILNGGGMKGICFFGILQCLIDSNNINNFNIFIGSSVSSLILFLFLIGYSPQELLYFVLNYNFKELLDINIDNLFINNGLNDGLVIKKILISFIKTKQLDDNITFIDLFNKTKKLFIITGTNLTKKQGEYFSFLTTPNMKIIDAIRISTSIPFFFIPYKYNNYYYIDGSCTNDLAIKCLYEQPFINYILLQKDNYDNIKNNILSVYLDDMTNEFKNLFQYSFCVLNVLSQNNINFNDVQSGLIYMDYFTGDVAKIIEGKVKFSEKFIRTAIPCAIFPYENGAQYIICHSNDDSMFPLINKGDFVIIKKIESVDNIDSRIYLFLYKNNIYIKRLNKNINQIVVFSENKEYKTQYISNEDMKDLYILGEIVYTGHAIGQK